MATWDTWNNRGLASTRLPTSTVTAPFVRPSTPSSGGGSAAPAIPNGVPISTAPPNTGTPGAAPPVRAPSGAAAGAITRVDDTVTTTPKRSALETATAAALVRAILAEYGLLELTDFVMNLVLNGVTDPTLLRAFIEDTQAFRDRFPAMEMRREQGFSKVSARDYIDFENYAATLFQEWGFPPGFYDERADFTRFIAGSADLNQGRQNLQRRVQGSFAVVASAPQETRDWFGRIFGASGDAALASYILDPDRSIVALEKQVEIAQIGGTGAQFGFDLNFDRARGLSDFGVTEDRARQGFGQVRELASVFEENIGERTDFTAENEGFGAVFSLDGTSATRLENRIAQRRASFAGGGGFDRSQSGSLTGLGVGR